MFLFCFLSESLFSADREEKTKNNNNRIIIYLRRLLLFYYWQGYHMRRIKKKKKKFAFCLLRSSSILALILTANTKIIRKRKKITLQKISATSEWEREGQEGSSVDFLISQAPIKSASLGKNEWVKNKKKERINKVRIVHKKALHIYTWHTFPILSLSLSLFHLFCCSSLLLHAPQ